MAEGVFWIFISFFAVLGLLELFNMVQSYVCRQETRFNMLLIPIGDDSDIGVECRIHTAVAQFSSVLDITKHLFIVDVGMGRKNAEICRRLCELYDLQIITPDNVVVRLNDIYTEK